MERFVYTVVGVVSLAAVAAGLTQVAQSHDWMRETTQLAKAGQATPKVTPTSTAAATPPPTPTPTPTPVATATPTTVPVATPAVRTARANSYVRIRQGPSVNTPVVGELQAGYVVTLGQYSDAQWQEATYNGVHGYIFKAYLTY